jgi:hypothetical protein
VVIVLEYFVGIALHDATCRTRGTAPEIMSGGGW